VNPRSLRRNPGTRRLVRTLYDFFTQFRIPNSVPSEYEHIHHDFSIPHFGPEVRFHFDPLTHQGFDLTFRAWLVLYHPRERDEDWYEVNDRWRERVYSIHRTILRLVSLNVTLSNIDSNHPHYQEGVFFFYRNPIERVEDLDQSLADDATWSPSEALYFVPLPLLPLNDNEPECYVIREPTQTDSFLDLPCERWYQTRYQQEDVPRD
jgi:hypothetical protein